jgi:hypothetical protein
MGECNRREEKVGRVNKNSNGTIFEQEIQGLLQRWKRFEQFLLEVEKRQNEDDDQENCESKYA